MAFSFPYAHTSLTHALQGIKSNLSPLTSKGFSYPVHLSTSETCRDVSAQLQINMIGGLFAQDAEASATTLQHSLCQAISQPHEGCLQDDEHQLCPRALQNYKIVSISVCSAPHPVCLNQRAAQSSNIKKKKKKLFGGFIGGRGPTPSLIALLAPCGMLGTLIRKEVSFWR